MAGKDVAHKRRFLVLHDYGMGGSWWWVRARSAREVREVFAWIEVVADPETVARLETEELKEADIDALRMPAGLDELRAERDAQRGREGFGVLADRDVVYLRRRWDEEGDEPVDYLMEVGSDGRRLRQVELPESGAALRSGPDDWPLNPPVVDLFDPALVGQEISRSDFEEQWAQARPADSGH
ncbi:hypothetical protein [Streptomyces arenae]|uniref:hypothetical protein n=1 Tax=Streptomyces arenae TaxID=29301 RepID=UPI00265ADC1B|nr:hypothetical protein [Streptomyces arenae]MCG7206399.1 hypothetical protein [Streptomyces arenae]